MAKEKTPKEASTLFHNIMKTSVTPKKATEKKEVKPKTKK
jgi:hypothetical protein